MPYTIILKNGNRINESIVRKENNGRFIFDYNRTDIALFMLTVNDKTIAVDLQNGLFYINGIALKPDYALQKHNYKVVAYKRHLLKSSENFKDKIGVYLLGWKFNENGQDHQRIMFWNVKSGIIEIKRKR